MKKSPPNLLFVFSDQHRKCSLGCYGDEQVKTPNLDRLAGQGTKFENCFSNFPVCVPMRGSLLTGRYPWHHRALTNDLPVDTSTPSLADTLNSAGYNTGYIGKWHLGGIPRDKAILPGERLGFKQWKVANCCHTYDHGYVFDEAGVRHDFTKFQSVAETDLAEEFIVENAKKQDPWALFLSWSPPHEPFDAVPEEFLSMYPVDKLRLRGNVSPDYPNAKRLLQGYYGLISLLDRQFGRLTDLIDRLGLAQNTVIVYTSDHGDLLGGHDYRNKQLPHEESIAVPLLVRRPGENAGQTRRDLIGLTDLPVTVAGMLGLKMTGADGVDINETPREFVLIGDLVPCHQAADRGGHEWMGLRTERWTFARDHRGNCDVLFDNLQDPLQTRNLANCDAGAEVSEKLNLMLDRELVRIGYDFRPWQQMIREDGYLEQWNRSQKYFSLKTLEK